MNRLDHAVLSNFHKRKPNAQTNNCIVQNIDRQKLVERDSDLARVASPQDQTVRAAAPGG